jgi:hypothetical protein
MIDDDDDDDDDRTGWSRGNTLGFYLRSVRFKSQSCSPDILTEVFYDFPQPSQAYARIVSLLSHK